MDEAAGRSGRARADIPIANILHVYDADQEHSIDARNPNDAATEPHDITHAVDALRYLLVSHQRSAPVSPMTDADRESERLRKFKDQMIHKNQNRRTRFN